MEDDPATRFAVLRPAIIARWIALLHAELPPSPRRGGLVTPAMLDFMPAETLDRLAGRLIHSTEKPERADNLTSCGAMREGCPCGLDLLLTYYRTGMQALRAMLTAHSDTDRAKLVREFQLLAQEEMKALCGICLHRGRAPCRLQPLPALQGRANHSPEEDR